MTGLEYVPEQDPDRLRAEVQRLAESHDQVVGWLRESNAENARLRLAIARIFRNRRESDKIVAECFSVMPELCEGVRHDRS